MNSESRQSLADADLATAGNGKGWLWCNGRWWQPEEFPIVPTDRILLHGLGLFETLLAIDGRPVFHDRHLARLAHAASRLRWKIETNVLFDAMSQLLERNALATGRARIRLTLSAGSGKPGDLALGADHLLWMSAAVLLEAPEATAVSIAPFPRNEHSPLAGLKCASYAENLLALDHARRGGFDEALFFNTAGHLCEAATANVFLVKNGALFTPSLDCGCLPGITRAVALEAAAKLGIPCQEARLTRGELLQAGEIFLTSSTRGPVAVTRVGDQPLASGPITAALHRVWEQAVHCPADEPAIRNQAGV